jgi:hypothetical protein
MHGICDDTQSSRYRTSGEYLLFVFMCFILSRNGVSDNPGAVHRFLWAIFRDRLC